MLFVIGYFIRRSIREGVKSLAVPLLAFTLTILICTLGGIKEWLDAEYLNTMDNHAVVAELSDLTGEETDGLHVDMDTIRLFTGPGTAISLYEHTGDILLKRSLETEVGQGQLETMLVGITAIAADDNLAPDTGAAITFFDGYDESIFKTDELICVISEEMLVYANNDVLDVMTSVQLENTYGFFIDPELNPGIHIIHSDGGKVYVSVESSDSHTMVAEVPPLTDENIMSYIEMTSNSSGKVSYFVNVQIGLHSTYPLNVTLEHIEGETITNEMTLTVIGTVSGAESSKVYCPFWTVISFLEEFDDAPLYSERLSATVAENRELTEFKTLASLSFSRVRPIRSSMPFAMTIYDSTFYETIEPLLQNTILVDIAMPIVYVIAVCVGFLASTLLTRQRKSEFAVMRSVGIHRRDIFFGVISEQLILSLTGAITGCLLTLIIFRELSFERPAVLLGCYLLGTMFAAIKVAGTNVLAVMKEKE